MQIKNLSQIPFTAIVDCFNHSFEDYIVTFPKQEAPYFQNRWKAARVDYELSFGAFVEDQLVGFFITGIDRWQDKLTAFNMGTGVLPAFRGQRIVKQLYEFAFPFFQKKGVEQCLLEVIIGNDKAIRAYQSVGFEIERTLHCFTGTLEKREDTVLPPLRFRKTAVPRWKKYLSLQPYRPSWEQNAAAIDLARKDYEYWEFYENDQLIGYFIGNPTTGAVPQIGMAPGRWLDMGPMLFTRIATRIGKVKIINVESTATDLIGMIKRRKLANILDQYEMKKVF